MDLIVHLINNEDVSFMYLLAGIFSNLYKTFTFLLNIFVHEKLFVGL